MADPQRIYPVPDPEAPPHPTAPLVHRSSSRSEKGDPDLHRRQPPPQSAYPKPPKRRSCCCRCLCWILCIIILEIIIIGILAAVFFLAFKPKLPKYSVDSLKITQFSLSNNMSLYATFDVNITARNPNKKIGIYYESGSHLNVFYKGTELCEGSLPVFYQGHRNITVMNVGLTGQTQNGTELLQSLQQQQQTGTIPLNLRAKVPVKIKLGKLKLMKWKFLVRCTVNVDSLSADNVIRIRDDHCKYRFRF